MQQCEALEAYDHSPEEMPSNKTEENMQLCNNANTFDHLINEKVICKLVLQIFKQIYFF